ncbi:MAG: hypothetical protein O2967_03015 [Proteobacteria bacterium]|nr:hypothetical protein [Pseudomonadota bacterium]
MNISGDNSGLPVYDPRGVVEAEVVSIAARVTSLDGLRLGVLDNTKWNGNRLLRGITERLCAEHDFAAVNQYAKESFSKNALPELVDQIVAENDIVLTAIGD